MKFLGLLLAGGAAAYSITVVNNCNSTIWPAAYQHNFDNIYPFATIAEDESGVELPSGYEWTISVPDNWIGGRIWARQSQPASVYVTDYDFISSLTVAEFGYGGGMIAYDISRVQGWNLGCSIVASDGQTLDCASEGCASTQAFLLTDDYQAVRESVSGTSFTVTFCPA